MNLELCVSMCVCVCVVAVACLRADSLLQQTVHHYSATYCVLPSTVPNFVIRYLSPPSSNTSHHPSLMREYSLYLQKDSVMEEKERWRKTL